MAVTARVLVFVAALALGSACSPAPESGAERDTLVFGIFLASIEEGGRMMTPIRLLPFEHPDALGHEFPNAQRQHIDEVRAEEHLGTLLGLKLSATLRRYPHPPATDWLYQGQFAPPDTERIVGAEVVRLPFNASPVVGLRALAVLDGDPVAFLTDTRNLTLEQRGMERATTSGLDMTRAEFLAGLRAVADRVPGHGAYIAVIAGPGTDPAE